MFGKHVLVFCVFPIAMFCVGFVLSFSMISEVRRHGGSEVRLKWNPVIDTHSNKNFSMETALNKMRAKETKLWTYWMPII